MRKNQIKLLFYTLCYYLGITYLFYVLNRRALRILNYHHVLPRWKQEDDMLFGYSHTIDVFEAHLRLVTDRFTCTSRFGEPGSVVITFDDGAKNNLIYAAPLLNAYRVPAYFFVVDKLVGRDALMWVDQVFLWAARVPYGSYQVLDVHLDIRNEQDRITARATLMRFLRANYERKDALLRALSTVCSLDSVQGVLEEYGERFRFMSEADLQRLCTEGHFVGFHSHSHDLLAELNLDELQAQVEPVEPDVLHNTRAFAIPFGGVQDYNEEVVRTLREAGYTPILANHERPQCEHVLGRLNLPNTANKYVLHAYLSGLHFFVTHRRLLQHAPSMRNGRDSSRRPSVAELAPDVPRELQGVRP